MSLDFLDEHRDAVERVLDAYEGVIAAGDRLVKALSRLPPELQARVAERITRDGKIAIPATPLTTRGRRATVQAEQTEASTPTVGGDLGAPSVDKLPGPKQVVVAILKDHPNGIHLAQIIRLARGKFATASRNPDHVVRTIVSQLRKEAYVERDNEGLERLTPFFSD